MENLNKGNGDHEEVIIENRYEVTKELMKKWLKDNKITTYFRIFWVFIALCGMGMAIYCITLKDIQDSVLFFIFVTIALLNAYKNNLLISRRYRTFTKTYKKNSWERRILFFDDYIETNEENIMIVRIPYSDIINVEKVDECIKLKISTGGFIRIYKNAFVKSNFDECEEFLSKKVER